jgi:restriction endonuclease Mrr
LWHKVLGALVEGSYDTLATELLDRILAQPPMFLETLSLKLLQAMGYGGLESLLEHTGKPGDSGLDGMVRQHALVVGTAFAHNRHVTKIPIGQHIPRSMIDEGPRQSMIEPSIRTGQ